MKSMVNENLRKAAKPIDAGPGCVNGETRKKGESIGDEKQNQWKPAKSGKTH